MFLKFNVFLLFEQRPPVMVSGTQTTGICLAEAISWQVEEWVQEWGAMTLFDTRGSRSQSVLMVNVVQKTSYFAVISRKISLTNHEVLCEGKGACIYHSSDKKHFT